MPWSSIQILVGSMALLGIPCLAGYYSKDVVLLTGALVDTGYSTGILALGFLGILLTSGYSAKIFFIGFVSLPVGYRLLHSFTHEVPSIASGILSVLVLGSILVGFLLQDLFTGSSTDIYWSTDLTDLQVFEYWH